MTASLTSAQIALNVDGGDWDDPVWGPANESATAGNDYIVNNTNGAFDLDLPGGAPTTFAGDSLTIVSGSRADFKQDGTATWILDGGTLRHTSGGNNFDIGGSLDITANGGAIDYNNGSFTVSASLTGSGDLSLTSGSGNTSNMLFSGGGSFSGTLNFTTLDSAVNAAALDFSAAYSNASVVFSDPSNYTTGLYDLDSTDTFAAFTVGSTSLAPGTYTYTDLTNEGIGDLFTNNSGSLTVVPEPSVSLLLLGSSALLLLVRRRVRS